MARRTMEGRGATGPKSRATIYCVVPFDLAATLHDLLRHHFRDERSVEVIVEQRGRKRRRGSERRAPEETAPQPERRMIRNVEGRRVGERRATELPVKAELSLPRRARPHAHRLVFFERLEPTTLQAEDLDTARLVTRIQAGDQDGFSELYMRYFDRVYAYMRIALRNPDEAEDGTQAVFMRVLTALPRYRRGEQPFRAWLFRIVRNYTLDQLKRQSRFDLTDPADIEDSSVVQEWDDELPALDWISDRELLLFIERLPLAQRQVLLLRFMLDMTTPDIARVLNRSPESVRLMQSRALRFLRERLSAVGREPRGSSPRAPVRRRFKQAPVLRSRRYMLVH